MRKVFADEEDRLNTVKMNNKWLREISQEISLPWQKDYNIQLGILINDIELNACLNVYFLLKFH